MAIFAMLLSSGKSNAKMMFFDETKKQLNSARL